MAILEQIRRGEPLHSRLLHTTPLGNGYVMNAGNAIFDPFNVHSAAGHSQDA